MSTERAAGDIVAGLVSLPFILVFVFDGFWKTSLLQHGPLTYWEFDFFKWVLLPCISLLALHRFATVAGKDYGLSAELGIRDILIVSFLPFISLFLLYLVVSKIVWAYAGYPTPYFSNIDALKPLGSLWILGAIYMSTTAGLWESIFLIGLPWFWFSRGKPVPIWRARLFALALAVVFAAGHWEGGLENVTATFAFQLLAVWWYLELRTLWPIVPAHFLIDLIYFWPSN